jgi:hypothetical protein
MVEHFALERQAAEPQRRSRRVAAERVERVAEEMRLLALAGEVDVLEHEITEHARARRRPVRPRSRPTCCRTSLFANQSSRRGACGAVAHAPDRFIVGKVAEDQAFTRLALWCV